MLLLSTSFFLGAVYKSIISAFQGSVVYKLESLILVSRSPDWKFRNGFYAAAIVLVQNKEKFNVVGKIHIGDMNYFEHIQLGSVNSKEEAYSTWGKVEWTDDSLIIGNNEMTKITVSRSKIEHHR